MQTDRNLLFGVLAFQDEYIDLAQLAAICRAWAADKTSPTSTPLAFHIERQRSNVRDEQRRNLQTSDLLIYPSSFLKF